jgi:hypothetical protein
MEIADHNAIRSQLIARHHIGLIMLGYAAFAIVAIAMLYLASIGPGITEAELAMATVFP